MVLGEGIEGEDPHPHTPQALHPGLSPTQVSCKVEVEDQVSWTPSFLIFTLQGKIANGKHPEMPPIPTFSSQKKIIPPTFMRACSVNSR